MYLRPFLLIQIFAFLTTEIWACLQLRSFGLEFMTKLKALTASGYVPIPLPHEMANYLHFGSLARAGTFFTFTLGFTLGIVAFGGSFCLNRYRLSTPIRLGWTVFISALFSLLVGFSVLGFLLLIAFFGVVHLAVRIPDASFHKAALFSLIPLVLIAVVYQVQGFLPVRDYLLQNSWGRKVVTFYYRHSPLPAELITPPTERTQVVIWTHTPLRSTEKAWLLKTRIYTVSTRKGADLALPGDPRTGPGVLEAIREEIAGSTVKWLKGKIRFSIFLALPFLAIMLLFLLATDRLFTLSKYYAITLLLCLALLAALLIHRPLFRNAGELTGTLQGEKVEDIRNWVLSTKKTHDSRTRDRLVRLVSSTNPAVRLWAATALAYLPSKDNVEVLKSKALRDPIAIVRCKAIFALSHQGDRGVIPFLESRLKGSEDWYVKHYLFLALRRLGWIG